MKKIKDVTRCRRFFRIGELVYNAFWLDGDGGWGKILLINGMAKGGVVDENTMVTLEMKDGYKTEILGDAIYKICKSMTKFTGNRVCFEHLNEYPYYVPSQDANYYGVELSRNCFK